MIQPTDENFELDYQLSENEDFIPCTMEQLDTLENLLCSGISDAEYKKERLNKYIQGMRENHAKGWDTSGHNLDGPSLQSYILFLKQHPEHTHRIHVLSTGEISVKWENKNIRFGRNGARCTTKGYQKLEDCSPWLIQTEWSAIEEIPQTFTLLRERLSKISAAKEATAQGATMTTPEPTGVAKQGGKSLLWLVLGDKGPHWATDPSQATRFASAKEAGQAARQCGGKPAPLPLDSHGVEQLQAHPSEQLMTMLRKKGNAAMESGNPAVVEDFMKTIHSYGYDINPGKGGPVFGGACSVSLCTSPSQTQIGINLAHESGRSYVQVSIAEAETLASLLAAAVKTAKENDPAALHKKFSNPLSLVPGEVRVEPDGPESE